MTWLDRVKENIFPLSNEKVDIKRALEEWRYDGIMHDPESDEEQCQICGQQNIRYQFEIINKNNNNNLLIGSECVKRFNINVLSDGGDILNKQLADKKVDRDRRRLIVDVKTKSLLNSLIKLSKVDQGFSIDNFIEYYKKRKAFTPLQLFLVIWRLDKFNVPYNKTYFKTIIRRDREKDQLMSMEEWKLKKIYPCLSKSQKEFVENEKIIREESKKNWKINICKKVKLIISPF